MQRYRKGLSLIELLVVIGIILILVAILVPVLIRAKASSFQSNDISNLRQMAVAGSLYEQEYASPALGSAPLVAVGLIPKSICTSALDRTRNGLANEVASILTAAMPGHDYLRRDYRVSYLGLWDYVYSESWMEKYVANNGNPGWLVSTGEADYGVRPTYTHPIKGRYLRLLFSGSVIHREYAAGTTSSGVLGYAAAWMFADYDAGEKTKFLEDSP